MANIINTPDYIFESSWEVCNKVGGIYTVLSTKAKTLQTKLNDKIIFIALISGMKPFQLTFWKTNPCLRNGKTRWA